MFNRRDGMIPVRISFTAQPMVAKPILCVPREVKPDWAEFNGLWERGDDRTLTNLQGS